MPSYCDRHQFHDICPMVFNEQIENFFEFMHGSIYRLISLERRNKSFCYNNSRCQSDVSKIENFLNPFLKRFDWIFFRENQNKILEVYLYERFGKR